MDGPVARMLLPRPLADGNFGQLPPVLVHQTVQMLHRQRQLQICDDLSYFSGLGAFSLLDSDSPFIAVSLLAHKF